MSLAALPYRGLAKAIGCALTLRDGLVHFVDDGRMPIDTNLFERHSPSIGWIPGRTDATRRTIDNAGTVSLQTDLASA